MTASMANERIARRALELVPDTLSRYGDFLGTGVVPAGRGSLGMLVAIYVSKPRWRLSKEFLAQIPRELRVRDKDRLISVKTKVVNLGNLSA